MPKEIPDYMIVGRVKTPLKSPPNKNPIQKVYSGKPIEISSIMKELNLDFESAKSYYYSITFVTKIPGRLRFESAVYDLNEIVEGTRKYSGQNVTIPLSCLDDLKNL